MSLACGLIFLLGEQVALDAGRHVLLDLVTVREQVAVRATQLVVVLAQGLDLGGHGGDIRGQRLDGVGGTVGVGCRRLGDALHDERILLFTAAGLQGNEGEHQHHGAGEQG